jgi:hypothetical protein
LRRIASGRSDGAKVSVVSATARFAPNGLRRGRGLDLGGIRIDAWCGKQYGVFFLREAENGYCYCFIQPVSAP